MGPLSGDIIAREKAHQLPGAQSMSDLAGIAVERARNAEVWDQDGNRYLDFFTGVGVCNIGHAHPRLVDAVTQQVQRTIVGTFFTDVRSRYYELLSANLPPQLQGIHMYSTGSEAVEVAVKLARHATGRQEVLSFWGGFHGKTQGAISLHGGPRKRATGPMVPGAVHAPYAYCYRCPLHLAAPDCGYACVGLANEILANASSGELAAIIVEPVQGTNGNIVPPAGYLRELRRLADQHGALLILDEVITGFGRTGTLFALERDTGSVPDILVLGKSMASGVPASAVVSSPELVKETPFAVPSAAASTFGGNPLAASASLATLETILDEGLSQRAARLGETLNSRLQQWTNQFEIVGNAASLGLMAGIELVVPETKDPLPKARCLRLFRELLARGVLAMAYDSKIRLYPPLTIPEEQLAEGLEAFEASLGVVSELND